MGSWIPQRRSRLQPGEIKGKLLVFLSHANHYHRSVKHKKVSGSVPAGLEDARVPGRVHQLRQLGHAP